MIVEELQEYSRMLAEMTADELRAEGERLNLVQQDTSLRTMLVSTMLAAYRDCEREEAMA